MKRIISIILTLILLIFNIVPFAQAADITQTEYFEDGSYFVFGSEIDIENEDDELSLGFISKLIEAIKRLINLILGKEENKIAENEKYVHYYDKNGVHLWSVYLS